MQMEPRDRGFARMLALTTLRRLASIDAALDARLQKPPPDTVRNLLRIGTAQALFMDVPAFAAVDSTVRLAQSRSDTRPFKGLVNAVLRAVAREGAPDVAAAPDWLYARWRAAFGEAAAAAIAAQISQEPPTDLTLKPSASPAALAEALEAQPLPGGSLRSSLRGDVSRWPGYEAGDWWVQDAAAAVPARLLDVRPGENALDLCAAPGGKTLQLAAAGARVVAVDRSASRLKRVRENLARTGLDAEVVGADAGAWADPRTFDAVLLDAPCSATGTFRRHPDVLWAARPSDIAKLAGVQSRLLDAAADRTRPGGRLVYCVCSLEPEEGEAQLAAFLARRADFQRIPVQPGEGGAPEEALTPAGDLRLLPSHWAERGGVDGFFVARLSRAL